MASLASLQGREDHYGGFIVDANGLPSNVEEFTSVLMHSLNEWRQLGKRGIWLKVPIQKSVFIPVAVDAGGFQFHHAEQDYVMLTRWLPDTPCTLPPNASHQVGVGAFVLNDQGQVLVVQERSGPLRGKQVWKMPTGLVTCGENLSVAAEREVLEETGVRAHFHAVLTIRQSHGFAFGKSDLFFVCALSPEPGLQRLTAQESEIEAVAWMDLDEWMAQEFFRDRPAYTKMISRCKAYAEGRYQGLAASELATSFAGQPAMQLVMHSHDSDEDTPEADMHRMRVPRRTKGSQTPPNPAPSSL